MGKALIVFFLLLLVACPSFAGQPHFSAVVSVTDVNTNTPIVGVRGNSVLIKNDGPDEVYFDVLTGEATATGAPLLAGEAIVVTAGGSPLFVENVGLICAAGETATVRIFAFPSE